MGVVVYTGYDTKIIQNQGKIQTKVSHVERKVNIIQLILLIVLIILAAVCTVGYHLHHNVNNQRQELIYLIPQVSPHQT